MVGIRGEEFVVHDWWDRLLQRLPVVADRR